MVFGILSSVLLLAAVADSQEVPEVLAKAISRRMAFKTAYYRYERLKIYSWGGARLKNRFEARIGGEDMYWLNMGDDEGVLFKDYNTGQPIFGAGYACSPRHTVRCRSIGDEWFRYEGDPKTTVVTIGGSSDRLTLADPRSFGLSVEDLGDKSPAAFLAQLQAKPARWSQAVVDGMIEVTGEDPNASQERGQIVWVINPEQDDAIVEVRAYRLKPDGERILLDTTKNDYTKSEIGWRLARTEYHAGTERSQTEVIHHAEFDRKEHPQVIDADALGLPAGARVADIRVRPSDGRIEFQHYLGAGTFVSKDEWNSIKHQYDLNALKRFEETQYAFGFGEFPQWWMAEVGTLGLNGVEHQPDLWEAYVRRWILRRNHATVVDLQPVASRSALSEAQIKAAWAILKDCRERAEPVVRRMAEEAKASASDRKSHASAGKKPPDGALEVGAAPNATSSANRHQRKLADIFEILKKRLDGLLRSEQEDEEQSGVHAKSEGR